MATSTRRDPLETPPPRFGLPAAEVALREIYGLSGSVTPLDSERDQNFHVRTHDDQSFLLKFSNQADDLSALEMQTEAMRHIKAQDPELPVMQPLRTATGAYLGVMGATDLFPVDISADDGHRRLLRRDRRCRGHRAFRSPL